jgi:hypothetical protein
MFYTFSLPPPKLKFGVAQYSELKQGTLVGVVRDSQHHVGVAILLVLLAVLAGQTQSTY